MVKSYPEDIRPVTSIIYDFWKDIGELELIN